jgi:hypothetical protein
MDSQRILGVLLLLAGVGLLIFGMNASHSMADQMSNSFTGKFTQATTWYILGGIGTGILGLFLLLSGMLGKRS